MARLTTQAGGVSLGRGVAAGAGLVSVMILSRLLSREDYGTYRQIWVVYFLLAPVMELGLTQSASYFGAQLVPQRQKTYITQNSLLLLASGILTSLAVLSFAAPISRLFGNADLVEPLRAFALFFAFALPFDLTENLLVALGRAGWSGVITAASAIVQAAITLAAFLTGASITQVFVCLTIFACLRWLTLAGAFLYIYRNAFVSWNLGELREQLLFSLPMGLAVMAGLLSRQLDKVIVSSHFSTEQFAVYANGSYDIPLINIVTLSVTAVLVPAIVRAQAAGRIDEVKRIWHEAARRVATLFYPVFAFLLIAARPFMILLFSHEYADSAAPFRIFLFLFPIRIAFHSGLQRALGRTRQILVSSIAALVISLVLALVLVRVEAIGILGPAIAAMAGAYFAAAYVIVDCSRALGWSWREYFPWAALGRIMAVSLIAAAPAVAVGWLLREQSELVQLLLMGIAYLAVYLALGETTRTSRAREWIEVARDVLRQR
ncbi:MAG: oligosaccharide flippase family protein [Candidatus Eisenbacteria bacterium]|nr:oligosaccharide flippase family protein [Candidatus Eisenbacteria bacterium]